MDIFLNPNTAYLILLAGIFLAILAIATPGTGLLELSAVFCFVFAGYAIYNLTIHWWALGIVLLSFVPFVFAVRGKGRELYLGLSILMLIVGSLFLFASEDSLISVNPVIAIGASTLMSGALWLILRKSLEAISRQPAHSLDALVGQIGDARSMVSNEGNVYVAGELWSARSETEIPAGSQVRVIRREAFTLVVEKI